MKTVLVMGASGGIGSAAALELARRGWNVALHYRSNQAAARQVERDILALGGMAKTYQADLTQEAQVEALFAAAEGDFGFVEGLVNNAGTAWKGLFTDMTLGDWRQVLDADLTSVFLCCRRALPPMIRRKRGSIVNVSSMWGQVGASCEAAYSAAKAGVIGLTKALAQEEGPSGIRVNCLAPGVIDTPMNGDLSPEDVAALREGTPLGRTGTPREAGEARKIAERAAAEGVPARLYACGGDGTLNEVVNGAAGHDFLAVTNVPKGTGNDFLKLFGPQYRERFSDLEALAAGPQTAFDLMDCNGKLGLDVVCAGVDARVAAGAVVLDAVPPDATAVGVPARVVRVAGKVATFADDVDQIHVADPLLEEIDALSRRLEALERQLRETNHRTERTA